MISMAKKVYRKVEECPQDPLLIFSMIYWEEGEDKKIKVSRKQNQS